jgi:hypothetical protein
VKWGPGGVGARETGQRRLGVVLIPEWTLPAGPGNGKGGKVTEVTGGRAAYVRWK